MADSASQVSPGHGVVYTETVVFAPPEQFAADAPYQIVILTLDAPAAFPEEGRRRLTVRIAGDRVKIGDRVEFAEVRGGVPFYRKR